MRISPVAFGKHLMANCQIQTNTGKAKPCKIYELTKEEDIDYFCQLKKSPQWVNSEYLEMTNQMMLSPLLSNGLRTFGLETEEEGCIGFVTTVDYDFEPNKTNIEFLETSPKYIAKNKKRELKYIGETLMAFVIGLAQKNEKDKVCVRTVAPKSRKFYGKACSFREDYKGKDGLVLNKQSYNKFLDKHKEKTGSEITFIG